MAKQYPGTRGFGQTLLSCGTNARNIEDFFHSLSWEKKLSPFYNADLAYTYFSDPSLFFLVLNKFWADDQGNPPDKNIFALFIRFVIRGIRKVKDDEVGVRGERDIPYILSAIDVLDATYSSDTMPLSISVLTTEAPNKPIVAARKRFLEDMLKYVKHVSSWPLNEDKDLYRDWRQMITVLKVVPNSEEEQQFIDVYKNLESKLATLTSFMMSGKGLAPMPLYFGVTNPPETRDIVPVNLSVEDYEDQREAAYEKYLQAEAEQAQNSFNEPDEATAARFRQNTESAYNAYRVARSNVPWEPWPEGKYFEMSNIALIDRWYAWAAQFWLKTPHSMWFRQLAKLSRTEDTASLFRSAQIVVLDDSSGGCSRFGRYGLNALSMPHLIYVYTLRNESPWWRPPELGWDELNTDAAIAVEKIPNENMRFEVWKERLNALKVSLDEGLVLGNGNVVIYTTSPEIIGYCLVNSVNVIIYNNWLADQPIGIKSLREQVLRQRSLLGRLVTPLLPESTIILTFVVLLAVSCSSGIPMYVGFGWNNVFSQWVNLVREYQKLVKPDRNNPKETCAWLARRGIDERIIINRNLFIPLVSRVLHSKFAADRPPTKLMSAYNIWSTQYKKLINEDRIGTGRVEPIPILKIWRPYTNELYQSSDNRTDEFKRNARLAESREAEELQLKEYEERRNMWQERKDEFNKKQVEDYEGRKQRYRTDIAEPAVSDSVDAGTDYDRTLADMNQKLRDKQALQFSLTEEIRDIEQQEVTRKDAVEEAKRLLDETTKAKNLWASQGYGASLFGDVPRVTQLDVDARLNALRLEQQSLSLLMLDRIRKEEQLKLAVSNAEQMDQDINNLPVRPQALDITVLMDRWEASNPTNYEEFPEPEPELGAVAFDEPGNDEMNFLNVVAGVELNEMEDNYDIDSDADEEEKELKANKDVINEKLGQQTQKWAESYEWMYAQRQMFQDKYYAPFDFDELLTRFRIRLRDWTGASIITINT